MTCVAIYMLVMSFSQKGIDELRKYQSHMEMRHPEEDGFELSRGFDEALGWFRSSDSSKGRRRRFGNERVREWKAAEAVVDRRREEVILGRVFPGLC